MKKKVLTVDDSRTIRNMLLVTLNNAGFETIQAEDGVGRGHDARGLQDLRADVDVILAPLSPVDPAVRGKAEIGLLILTEAVNMFDASGTAIEAATASDTRSRDRSLQSAANTGGMNGNGVRL